MSLVCPAVLIPFVRRISFNGDRGEERGGENFCNIETVSVYAIPHGKKSEGGWEVGRCVGGGGEGDLEALAYIGFPEIDTILNRIKLTMVEAGLA